MSAVIASIQTMTETVSPALARRIALAAQGFGRPGIDPPGIRRVNGVVSRLGLLQIDSVNVFERSHYLPAFSRLGAYDRDDLDRLAFGRRGRLIEYWAHQAAFIPRALWGAFAFRRAAYRQTVSDPEHWLARNDALRRWILSDLAAKGPQRASELEHEAAKGDGGWWGWSDAKLALEWMWRTGEVVCVDRVRFERVYALPHQVPSAELAGAEPPFEVGIRSLVEHAASALGIATEADLADYWRMKRAPVRSAVRELEDDGVLLPLRVPGWDTNGRPMSAWLHRDARRPRRIEAAALLSPFDPVVWFRPRTERMFGFHYRIEIYTPEPKRIFGYYSLPVLIDDRLVGRIDLKADRKRRTLLVQSSWVEPGAPADTAARVVPALEAAVRWQGLEAIQVVQHGDLARDLAGEVARSGVFG
jgi:uncharacterized protein